MSDGVIVNVKGSEKHNRMFDQLGKNALRVARSATGKALTPLQKATRDNARHVKDTGATARSIGRAVRTYKSTSIIYGVVGPRTNYFEESINEAGFFVRRVPAKTMHIQEFGSVHSRPLFIMTQAFNSTFNQQIRRFQDASLDKMIKIARKELR